MANSLPVGQWRWHERWQYEGQEGEFPSINPKPQNLSKTQGTTPPKPFRKTLVGVPHTTDYRDSVCGTANEIKARTLRASQDLSNSGGVDGKHLSRTDTLVYHHLDPFFHMTEEQKKKIRPEERSWWLWSRINPMHCVQPYQTDSQRHFVDHTKDKDPVRAGHNRGKLLPKVHGQAAASPEKAAQSGQQQQQQQQQQASPAKQ